MNSLRVTNSSCFTLHLVWGSSHPPPCLPGFHPPASVIVYPSCFLSRHWPFRWCLSRPRWPVAPLGAIMDSVLIACWRTEAVLHSLIADSLESTAVCLCDCCSNAAWLENSLSMCLHICRRTQCTWYTHIYCNFNMYTFLATEDGTFLRFFSVRETLNLSGGALSVRLWCLTCKNFFFIYFFFLYIWVDIETLVCASSVSQYLPPQSGTGHGSYQLSLPCGLSVSLIHSPRQDPERRDLSPTPWIIINFFIFYLGELSWMQGKLL